MKKESEKCSKHGNTLTIDRGGNEYCLECARELRKTMQRAYTLSEQEKPKIKAS